MKKINFNMKKWTARGLVALGALLGISACSSNRTIRNNPAAGVYGPPPTVINNNVKVIEDVYGPPVGELDNIKQDTTVTIVEE